MLENAFLQIVEFTSQLVHALQQIQSMFDKHTAASSNLHASCMPLEQRIADRMF
jgi:hypothetical protein